MLCAASDTYEDLIAELYTLHEPRGGSSLSYITCFLFNSAYNVAFNVNLKISYNYNTISRSYCYVSLSKKNRGHLFQNYANWAKRWLIEYYIEYYIIWTVLYKTGYCMMTIVTAFKIQNLMHN